MYKYDKDTNIFKIQKLDIQHPETDLLKDIRESYFWYLRDGFQEDVQYLASAIETLVNQKPAYRSKEEVRKDYKIGVTARLEKKISTSYKNEIKVKGSEYYPVMAKFSINGVFGDEFELYRIPYMDEQLGTLNFDKKIRVMTSALRSADDISFNKAKGEVVLTIKNRRIGIHCDKDKIYFDSPFAGPNKTKVPLETAVNSFIIPSGETFSIRDIFSNHVITNSLTNKKFQQTWQIEDDASKVSFYDVYTSPDTKISPYLRSILNESLSLDSALGLTLARPVYLVRDNSTVPAGTIITLEVMKSLKRNLVNMIHVKKLPHFEKMYLTTYRTITTLKRGCKVTPLIKSRVPELAKYNYVPQDTQLSPALYLEAGSLITDDIISLLDSLGVPEIELSSTKSGKNPKTYRFEQEFIGNDFHKVSDFVEPKSIPKAFSADDYIYADHIDSSTFLPMSIDEGETLTLWDFLALTSLAGRCFTMPELREVFNRDVDFLKKIDLIGDSFSLYFRSAIRNVLNTSKRKLQGQVSNIQGTGIKQDIFYSLTSDWHKALWDSKLLKPCDDTNPVSLLTQVRRVTSSVGSSKESPVELRNISIGYFGKICPFETPESGNIGLVNTLAHGCRIIDGIPHAPYYAVRSGGGTQANYVSKKITYLSAKEESKYVIGDILSLDFLEDEARGNRSFTNKRVIARVPDYTTGDRSKLANIDSYSLDYVTAYPEQHLSVTSQLIPFAQNNDAVRDSFALSRIRQALNLQEGEPPRVMTSMYREMFESNPNFVVRAETSGEVLDILSENFYILYDGEEEPRCIKVPEIRISDNCVIIMNYRKNVGQRFKKGEVLVDSSLSRDGFFSPGANLLTAFMCYYGHNYEDSCPISASAQRKFVSISNDVLTEPIKVGQTMYQSETNNRYRYINPGDTVVEIGLIKEKDKRTATRKKIRAEKISGILYSISVEGDDANRPNLVCKTMKFRKVGTGDKMCGRHANKGVGSKTIEDHMAPCLPNGKVIEFLQNPAGINSRMNIGQVMEGQLGLVATIWDTYIESNGFNGATDKEISELVRMTWTACNESIDSAQDKFPSIPPSFFDRARRLPKVQQNLDTWKGAFNPDGTAWLFNPVTGKLFEEPVTIGVNYMLKLVQEVDEKIHARATAITEPYSMFTKQPTKGSSAGGGQKIGEMEAASLISHGVSNVLYEMMNAKSDNVFLREQQLLKALDINDLYNEVTDKIDNFGAEPQALTIFRYCLESLGMTLEGDELADLTDADINRWEVDIKSAIWNHFLKSNSSSKGTANSGINDGKDYSSYGSNPDGSNVTALPLASSQAEYIAELKRRLQTKMT